MGRRHRDDIDGYWEAVFEKVDLVVDAVAEVTGVSYDQIMGKDRRQEIVDARYAAICKAHEKHPELSTTDLGKAFDRHHTTILHALGQLSKDWKAA